MPTKLTKMSKYPVSKVPREHVNTNADLSETLLIHNSLTGKTNLTLNNILFETQKPTTF